MVPMTVEKYGTNASTVVCCGPRGVCSHSCVANLDAESLAHILCEHHAPTGEHFVAYLFVERAEQRIVRLRAKTRRASRACHRPQRTRTRPR